MSDEAQVQLGDPRIAAEAAFGADFRPAPPPVEVEPVAAPERVAAVDVLRGVALMGILVMNIPTFAWPDFFASPATHGTFTGWDRAIWLVQHVVFETKMMTLFSMLFGAGLILMADRAEKRGASLRRRYYRRVLILMLIGAIHGYFVWIGDILFWYAACGLLLYPVRNWSPRALIGTGLVLNLVIAAIALPVAVGIYVNRGIAAEAKAIQGRGGTLTTFQRVNVDIWNGMADSFQEDPAKAREEAEKEVATYRGGYLGILADRAPQILGMQTFGLIFYGLWTCGGRMLIGMGLMKLGVFAAARSYRFYGSLMLVGYGLGLPLALFGTWYLLRDKFGVVSEILDIGVFNHLGGLAMALGHAGLILLLYKTGWLAWPFRAVGAVGRMALTNYLTHSLVLSTLFYGYGFGLFNRVDRVGQMEIVLAIWAFQLALSPLWLAYFRYGPAEWAWRSLTYGEPQPLRRVG